MFSMIKFCKARDRFIFSNFYSDVEEWEKEL